MSPPSEQLLLCNNLIHILTSFGLCQKFLFLSSTIIILQHNPETAAASWTTGSFFISLCDLPLLSYRGLRSVSTGFAVPFYFSSLRCFQISRYGLETKKKRKESLCGSSRLKQLKCINSAPGPPPCQLYSAVTELSWQSESRAQIFGFLSTAAWSSVSLRPVGFDLSGGGNPHNLVMMSLFRAHQDQSASGAGGRVRTQGADRRTQTHTPRARTHAIIKK